MPRKTIEIHTMQIALVQANFRVGDIENNTNKIIDLILDSTAKGAELVVFTELAICGYPARDLLVYDSFIEQCYQALERIAKVCGDTAAIVGAPLRNPSAKGKKLLNAAVLLHKERIKSIRTKTLLPDYDVFDEYRYFEANTQAKCIELKGKKIALSICEDLWGIDEPSLYTTLPMEHLVKESPDFMINISASPFHKEQIAKRKHILCQNAQTYQLPLIYVNQVGGQTDIMFDGNSMVLNAQGNIVNQLSAFEEDTLIIDSDKILASPPIPSKNYSHIELIYNALVMGMRDYFNKLGFSSAVLGLSGGIDSAVCMAIATDALGAKNVRAVLMPSQYSSQHSIDDAVALAENLGSPYDIIPIEDNYHSVYNSLKDVFKDQPFGVAEENIQARLRGLILMAISNKFGPILLNTSNKSEAAVGYGTLYGDMNGGLSILGDVYKTEVFALAKYINRNGIVIPEHSISKPPSAELRPNQKDSDSLPDYDSLDQILTLYIEEHQGRENIINKGFEANTVDFVIKRVNMNEYKRHQMAPVLRVSKKAFGIGRKMPIAAQFKL